jgi:TonB family protein
MTNHGDKMEPAANSAPHTSETDPFGSLADVVKSDEVVEPVQTDVRFSFKKILTAKQNWDPEIDQVAASRNWQDLFRWVLAGATVCLGILAVGLGVRLSEDQLITSITYRTVKAFFLDTFTPSNAAPLVVHNVPTNVPAHPLHSGKELKTSRVHVTDPSPPNRPMVPTKYEVLDAKTGRRYFPHTGTNLAVNFVRIEEKVGEGGPESRASAADAKLFSGPQVELGDGKIGKVSQKSSGELPVKEVIPEYPLLALQKSVQGRVALTAIITTDGSLRDVRVVGSPSMLDNAALSAVKEWRYQAHHETGRPVEVVTQIFVDFSISIEK